MTDDHRVGSADDAPLDQAIRRMVGALVEAAPEPPPLPTPGVTPAPTPTHEQDRRRWSAVAAAMLLIVGGVGWWMAAGDRDPVQPVATEAVPVAHQAIRWTQEVELPCEGGAGAGTTAIELELWVDVAGERVRQQATYADGAVRNQIWEGSQDHPARKFERGSSSYVAPTCPRWGAAAVDNTPGMMGRLAGPGPDLTPGDSSGRRIAVPGEHTDEIGRSAELVREESEGTAQLDDGGPAGSVPFRQTLDWYLEPGTGRLLQSTFRIELEGVYTVTTTTVVLADEDVAVARASFDTDGYELVYEAPAFDGRHATAEAVEPTVQVGPDRYWPSDPTAGDDPETSARRFATEVLGWTGSEVVTAPGPDDGGAWEVTVDDRRGHSVELTFVPIPGGWELLRIDSGIIDSSIAPDGNTQLDLPFPVGTTELVVEGHLDPGGRRAWRATIEAATAGVILPETTDDPMKLLILLYRDAEGRTIGAATVGGGRLRDPSTITTEAPGS
ncbi:MAG: hypothetical protein R2761_19575 [Acidimicrobiales bacterium]